MKAIQAVKQLIRLRLIDKVICMIDDDMKDHCPSANYEELSDLHTSLSLYYSQTWERSFKEGEDD